MIITSSFKTYDVNRVPDFSFLINLIKEENAKIIIDKNVFKLYQDLFIGISEKKLLIIEALETNKTIETALKICEIMTEMPAKRNAHIISIGGGIIQDITGFVANILYRGIKWTYVPTTLLAACDSCIGGKTSLNYKQFKNLLGTFYPPDHIYICSQFFNTLSERDYLSGLGEVVKFNIMYGVDGLSRIELNLKSLLDRNKEVLDTFLFSSLEFKKRFIEEDEFDKGVRINLNFAHTFGHAFETVSSYSIPHGTAVAMGTIIANRISLSREMLSTDIVERAEKVLTQIIRLGETDIYFDIEKIMNAIKKDKKQIDTNLTAVLLYDDFKIGIFRDLSKTEIQDAISHLSVCLGSRQ